MSEEEDLIDKSGFLYSYHLDANFQLNVTGIDRQSRVISNSMNYDVFNLQTELYTNDKAIEDSGI